MMMVRTCRSYIGLILIGLGIVIFVQDYLMGVTGILLTEFSPLSGLHHEWIGATVMSLGVVLLTEAKGLKWDALIFVLTYLAIVAFFWLAGFPYAA